MYEYMQYSTYVVCMYNLYDWYTDMQCGETWSDFSL